jgi:branched-subunit amino acid transport protein
MNVWLVVAVVGVGTIALKGLGPALLGGRPLPRVLDRLVVLLAPALLAALVVVQTLDSENGVVADARLAGVGAGAFAIALRAPLLVVVVVAAATTAIVRAVG